MMFLEDLRLLTIRQRVLIALAGKHQRIPRAIRREGRWEVWQVAVYIRASVKSTSHVLSQLFKCAVICRQKRGTSFVYYLPVNARGVLLRAYLNPSDLKLLNEGISK